MRARRSFAAGFGMLAALALILVWTAPAEAYEAYDEGCDSTSCHGDFLDSPYISLSDSQSWGDSLHDVHRYDMLNGDCSTCHSGQDESPVFLDLSDGGDGGLEPISCVGCHGRAEDNVQANPESPSGYGAGLRQHHDTAGQTVCSLCHADSDPDNYTPVGEEILPPYYANPGTGHNIPDDPCNPPPDFLEDYTDDDVGLDNDGDNIYDGADPNCAVPEPDAALLRVFALGTVGALAARRRRVQTH